MTNSLGEYIRGLRNSKKITTRELGSMIGYSYSHIGSMEKGRRKIRPDTLSKYIKAISSSDEEFNDIKEYIRSEYSIVIEDDKEISYTMKEEKPISLNNVIDSRIEIDGQELSVNEIKLMISVVRGYRQI